jgi:DnaK suppressor protein
MPAKEQLEGLRARVEAELAAVEAALMGGEKASVELDQTRVGRLSRMDAMQQQAMASGMRERLFTNKKRLEAALERFESGQFGVCCQCATPIAIERMQVDLGAPFCAECQEEIDDRHKPR